MDRNSEDWLNAGSLSRVALRKESVDRNARKIRYVAPDVSSLSARRAWIEITWLFIPPTPTSRRSPQGERG